MLPSEQYKVALPLSRLGVQFLSAVAMAVPYATIVFILDCHLNHLRRLFNPPRDAFCAFRIFDLNSFEIWNFQSGASSVAQSLLYVLNTLPSTSITDTIYLGITANQSVRNVLLPTIPVCTLSYLMHMNHIVSPHVLHLRDSQCPHFLAPECMLRSNGMTVLHNNTML